MSKSSQADETVLTAKEASTLIATLRPSTLLGTLKHPDFAMVVAIAFAGFRYDSNGLANPLVRRRLAEEATRNTHFAAKLRELIELARVAPAATVTTQVVPTSSPRPITQIDRSAEKYREERDRLKREVAEESDRRRTAERDLAQAKLDSLAASTAKAEGDREALRQKQRAERLERKLRRLELENAQLRRLAGTSHVRRDQPEGGRTPAAENESVRPETHDVEAPFAEAVRRLLDKQKWQPARTIAEDVLRTSPHNEYALAIRAAAAEGLGDIRSALQDIRSLVGAQIAHADMIAAARSLTQLYVKSSGHGQETKTAREFYVALSQSGEDFAPIREIFESLRVASPASYDVLKAAAQSDAASSLFATRPTGRVSADDALSIALGAGLPRSVTGRLAAGWIDRNEIAIVDSLRLAVAASDDATRTRLAAALDAATEGDGSYFRLVTLRTLAGPAVVDASNAAWSGQEMVASPKPRLGQVIALRQALREKGYFPILLIADANFPFVVDDPAAARKLVVDSHITLATGGTDADVLILQEAKRLHAPIVSNDYMTEWDPGQEVTKLQYTIAPTSGAVTIYR